MTRPTAVILATVFAWGCDSSPETADAAESPERQTIEPPARVIQAVPEARSAEDAHFSHVTDVTVDPDGRVYVGDFFQAAITVLGPRGDVVDRLGRSGAGPGEYRSVQNVQVFGGGDSLLVFDRAASRLTVYARGEPEPAYQSDLSDHTRVFPLDVWKQVSGNLLADYGTAYTVREDPDRPRMRLLRLLDPFGRLVRDSLVSYPENDRLVFREGGSLSVMPHPFGRRSEVRPRPDGAILVGWSGASTVNLHDAHGELLRRIPVGHSLVPVTRGERDRVVETVDRYHRRGLEEAIPVHWPEFKYLQTDDRSRIWVAPYQQGGHATRWTVLDPTGQPVAVVQFPLDLDIHLIRGGWIYGVATDSLDVPALHVFTLSEPLP